MREAHDLIGRKFHCLTVVGMDQTPSGSQWRCACNCGKITHAKTHALLSDHKKSCGHLLQESRRFGRNGAARKKRLQQRLLEKLSSFSIPNIQPSTGWTIDDSLDELTGLA